MSPELQAALARAKVEVAKVFRSKMGAIGWYLLAPSEKQNYAVSWCLGYFVGKEEAKREAKEFALEKSL
jgi:hypothetical protein